MKTWRSRVLNKLEGRKSQSKSTATSSEDSSEPVVEEAEPSPQTLSEISSKPETQKNNIIQIRECSVVVRQAKINKNMLQRRRNPTVNVPLSKIRDCVVLCNRLEVELHRPKGMENYNLFKQLKVKLRRLGTVSPRKSRLTKHSREISNKVRQMNGNVIKFESGNVSNVEKALVCKDKSDNSITCNNSEKIDKYEDEANKSDDGEDLSKAFNEGAICPHGKVFVKPLI